MSTIACRLGEQALELTAFDGKHARLVSDVALAPGQPLYVRVGLRDGLSLELKSTGSVKRSDGRFDVRARTVTLPRETREALLAHFG